MRTAPGRGLAARAAIESAVLARRSGKRPPSPGPVTCGMNTGRMPSLLNTRAARRSKSRSWSITSPSTMATYSLSYLSWHRLEW